MHKLIQGDILYHASYTEIKEISLAKCSKGKDFGHGFYLTSDFEQAQDFVKSSVARAKVGKMIGENQDYGYVNVYEISSLVGINEFDFQEADKNWLHYVSGNRSRKFFADEVKALEHFNVIGGKIANDQTATTLNLYIGYGYGEPGNSETDDFCIKKLLPNRLKDQYCFKDEASVKALKFIKSIMVKL